MLFGEKKKHILKKCPRNSDKSIYSWFPAVHTHTHTHTGVVSSLFIAASLLMDVIWSGCCSLLLSLICTTLLLCLETWLLLLAEEPMCSMILWLAPHCPNSSKFTSSCPFIWNLVCTVELFYPGVWILHRKPGYKSRVLKIKRCSFVFVPLSTALYFTQLDNEENMNLFSTFQIKEHHTDK